MRTARLALRLWAAASSLWGGVAECSLFKPLPPRVSVLDYQGELGGNATFQQLIDHSNPALGTFSQQYWYNTTYWDGPGSPVVLFTPGEVDAAPYQAYLTNRTMVGLYAQAIGAATILLEHRYYGNSTPYTTLDTKALQHLNLNNSVADLAHFARTVDLPFDTNHSSNAPQAIGGSYSGALAAWTEKLSPGTYWAYHASSGPVEAVYDYWSYFLPIQNGMPRNCSRDLERIVEHIDGVIGEGNATEIAQLKESFGLQDLSHADDFGAALAFPLGDWQAIDFYSNYSEFFQMCDTIEGVRAVSPNKTNTATNATIPSADGVGLEKALANFASWFKVEYLPGTCQQYEYQDWNTTDSVACFDTYNETSVMYTDWNANNTINRQWFWYICNEPFFYWQTGAPKDRPTIVSRYVTAEYFQRQCGLLFPKEGNYTFGSNNGRTAEDVNMLTEGWNLTDTKRLLWVNGEFDPWRSASVSSELRPGGPFSGTESAPLFLIPGGRHCSDLAARNGEFNKDVASIQQQQVKQMVTWINEFKADEY
ncbi:hypothetical protein VTK73DRAFT_6905 [Phialemonium thermophilum]|uniref:Uncharacterized protein n=1 Tax=Phialemonium thermophilum TaxID=223376 RepID=A0ABR3WHX1_9PEZI